MRLAVWAGGGDAPGMNELVARLVELAEAAGDELWAVDDGFGGLVEGRLRRLAVADVAWVRSQGGIFIGTSRAAAHTKPPGEAAALRHWQEAGLDAAVVMGGDGTLRHGGAWMASHGLPCVLIPATIDGDVPGSAYTLGFDSAANHAVSVIDRLAQSALSLPGRAFTVETLGGSSGHLGLAVAEATSAVAVAIPEYPQPVEQVAARLVEASARRRWALAVVGEGVVDKEPDWYARLAACLPVRLRRTVLGHAQRAGAPTFIDRRWARRWAEAAWARWRDDLPAPAAGACVWVACAGPGDEVQWLDWAAFMKLPAPKPDPAVYQRIWEMHDRPGR